MIPNFPSIIPTTTIPSLFNEMNLADVLKQTGIEKRSGASGLAMFQAICMSPFHGYSNINELCTSSYAADLGFSKDSLYRFMRNQNYDWQSVQLMLAMNAWRYIQKHRKPAKNHLTTLAVDDTFISRASSLFSELVANCFDHSAGKFCYGMFDLQCFYSDGTNSLPFLSQLVSGKQILCQSYRDSSPDSPAAARREDALKSKLILVKEMLLTLLNNGMSVDYLLADSWYCCDWLVNDLANHGVHSIMRAKSSFTFKLNPDDKKLMSQDDIFDALPKKSCGKWVLNSCIAYNSKGTKLQLVFVPYNRLQAASETDNNGETKAASKIKPPRFICILTNDTNISPKEVVKLYKRRWGIEINFKTQKQHLSLDSGCQSTDFNSFYAFTVMAKLRYILLECYRVATHSKYSHCALFRKIKEALTATKQYQYCCQVIARTQYRFEKSDDFDSSQKDALAAIHKEEVLCLASVLNIGEREALYMFSNISKKIRASPTAKYYSPKTNLALACIEL